MRLRNGNEGRKERKKRNSDGDVTHVAVFSLVSYTKASVLFFVYHGFQQSDRWFAIL